MKKSGYSRSKKLNYLLGFIDQADNKNPKVKGFVVFPKKGEVFVRSPESFVDAEGYIHGVD